MGGGVVVRRAVPGDAKALSRVAFAAKGHWGYPGRWMASWREDLTVTPGLLRRGEAHVAEVDGEIAGFYALVGAGSTVDLEHLWVSPGRIGTGLGRALFEHAMDGARALGARTVRIESDPHAEAFYLRMGAKRRGEKVYEIEGRERALPLMAVELTEDIAIEPITARDLPGIRDDLVGLLRDSVNGGATVGFLPPLSTEEAAEYWHEVREALEGGARRLLVARRDGRVVGTAQLDLATQTNGRHRAEVAKVLVHEEARRQGLGRRLMDAVEAVARDEGRTLLVLDTRQGEPSEAFYAALGYRRAGVIPNYARSADGTLHATVLFYKEL